MNNRIGFQHLPVDLFSSFLTKTNFTFSLQAEFSMELRAKYARTTARANIMEFIHAMDAPDSSSEVSDESVSTSVSQSPTGSVKLTRLIVINVAPVDFKSASRLE